MIDEMSERREMMERNAAKVQRRMDDGRYDVNVFAVRLKDVRTGMNLGGCNVEIHTERGLEDVRHGDVPITQQPRVSLRGRTAVDR